MVCQENGMEIKIEIYKSSHHFISLILDLNFYFEYFKIFMKCQQRCPFTLQRPVPKGVENLKLDGEQDREQREFSSRWLNGDGGNNEDYIPHPYSCPHPMSMVIYIYINIVISTMNVSYTSIQLFIYLITEIFINIILYKNNNFTNQSFL